MAFQVHETLRGGEFDERRVGFRAGRAEGDVHQRAAFARRRAAEQAALVQKIVKQLRLHLIAQIDHAHAALLFQPFQAQPGHVDGVGGGRVQHAARLRLLRPVENFGRVGAGVTQKVFAHDDDRQPRGADVLLRAGEDHAEIAHVIRLGQDVGRHIRHQRHLSAVGQARKARAVNGVVGGDVHVVRVRINRARVHVWHAGVAFLAGRRDHARVSVLLRLDERAVGEVAAVHVVRAGFQKVHRHGGELPRRAALKQQHLVFVRNAHQLAQKIYRAVENFLIRGRAVAHLHHRHARALIGKHLRCRALQRFLRHHRRPRGKIKNATHTRRSPFERFCAPLYAGKRQNAICVARNIQFYLFICRI